MTSGGHLSGAELVAWRDGIAQPLPGGLHLQNCLSCRARLREARELAERLAEARAGDCTDVSRLVAVVLKAFDRQLGAATTPRR